MDINASTYSDYMMIISPPAGVMETISKYKKATARVIGDYDGMHGRAHISITNHHRQMPGMMVQKLDCYQRDISRLKPVHLYVNGFNFFKHGATGLTVYAKIELNAEVNNWFKYLRRVLGDKTQTMVPHITVAKNIPADKFRVLWPKFIDQQYQYDFIPQSITVLSRPMIGGYQQSWTLFKELYFNNFA